jgi:hypothetical protein
MLPEFCAKRKTPFSSPQRGLETAKAMPNNGSPGTSLAADTDETGRPSAQTLLKRVDGGESACLWTLLPGDRTAPGTVPGSPRARRVIWKETEEQSEWNEKEPLKSGRSDDRESPFRGGGGPVHRNSNFYQFRTINQQFLTRLSISIHPYYQTRTKLSTLSPQKTPLFPTFFSNPPPLNAINAINAD